MIPSFAKENIVYSDDDGMRIVFKPMTRLFYSQYLALLDACKQGKQDVQPLLDAMADSVVVEWSFKGEKQPKPSEVCMYSDQWAMLATWDKLNTITPEEKKSS